MLIYLTIFNEFKMLMFVYVLKVEFRNTEHEYVASNRGRKCERDGDQIPEVPFSINAPDRTRKKRQQFCW